MEHIFLSKELEVRLELLELETQAVGAKPESFDFAVSQSMPHHPGADFFPAVFLQPIEQVHRARGQGNGQAWTGINKDGEAEEDGDETDLSLHVGSLMWRKKHPDRRKGPH